MNLKIKYFLIEREYAPTEFSAITFKNFVLQFHDFKSIAVNNSGVTEILIKLSEFSGTIEKIIDAPDIFELNSNTNLDDVIDNFVVVILYPNESKAIYKYKCASGSFAKSIFKIPPNVILYPLC